MKILLTIHHELNPNAGAAGVTLQLGREYQQLGHKVQYYSFDNLSSRLSGLHKSLLFPGFLSRHILYLCRQESIDVIDASTGDAWLWAKLLRNFTKQPPILITRSHGLEHTYHFERLEEAKQGNLHLSWKYWLYHGRFRLWEVATSLRCADLALFLNQRDLDYAVKTLGVKPERARLVANGMPEVFLNLPLQPISETKDSKIRIAQIGSYILRKGIHYSQSALNSILNSYPHVELTFLGTGCPESEVYANFDPAFRDRIRVIPNYIHEMLPILLDGHHIKLFAPISEGFGLALIEAMACGLAPITTATPGPLEIVHDGYDAIVTPTRDSQAIEQALKWLIENRSYLEQLRCHAHATAQYYSWTRIARNNLALYEEALSRRQRL
jgi:glycosyltransferase involved in cell wall biosynthesis